MGHLEDMKSKIEKYEKYRSENISKIEETRNRIIELYSSVDLLKKKIEENVGQITNTTYSIVKPEPNF